MTLVWILALVMGAAAPPAADLRVPVVLRGIHGLPSDTVATGAFTRAFRAAFADLRYATRRPSMNSETRNGSLVSGFRLIPHTTWGHEWKVEVKVSGPWDADAEQATAAVAPFSRGVPMIVEIETLAAGVVGEAADTTRTSIAILAAPEPRSAFFAQTGRAVGRLAVEALHHRTGDLDPDVTLRLEGAQRSTDRLPPAPKR